MAGRSACGAESGPSAARASAIAAAATRGSRRGPFSSWRSTDRWQRPHFRSSSRDRLVPCECAASRSSAHRAVGTFIAALKGADRSASIQFPSPPSGPAPSAPRSARGPETEHRTSRAHSVPSERHAADAAPCRSEFSLGNRRFTQPDYLCPSRSERVHDHYLSSDRLVRCGRTDRGRTTSERPGSTP